MKPNPVSNRQLTLLRKLNQRKHREEQQQFIAEGVRAVEQIIENGLIDVHGLFFDESQAYWDYELWQKYLVDIPGAVIPRDAFMEVSDTDTPQGVLALCGIPDEKPVAELLKSEGLVLAADGIQDPGNMGTIIRTAGWFGIGGLISGKGTVDLFHPKVVRSTAGATGVVPYSNADLVEVFPMFEKQGWSIFLLDAGSDAVPLRQIEPARQAILVVGNEAHGIDESLYGEGRKKVRITQKKADKGAVESLNAAIATGIALYQLG